MAKKLITELKEYFKAGKRPTESQFGDLMDSYTHLDDSAINELKNSEYTAYVNFPANYQVGDYIEFLKFSPEMASSSGYYEISVAYTRGNVASAATHLAGVSHSNPNLWRECGRINRNNYVADPNSDCFTIDVNGSSRKFRIRATKVLGVTTSIMSVVIKVRSINKNISWAALDQTGNDVSSIPLQPMTDEWELLVGSSFSADSAKVALKVNQQGNVGVGTQNPQQKLDVQGVILSQLNSNEGGAIFLENHSKTAPNTAKRWAIYNMTGAYGNSLQFWNYFEDGTYGARMVLGDTGNMALYGKLEAKDVVITPTPTADFVFAPDYNLREIGDLEKFISEKNHLPEIPSAKEMTENGLAVGDFQIKLLQKIEELTLYMISLKKEVDTLKLN